MTALRHRIGERSATGLGLLALEVLVALNAVGGAVYGLSGAGSVPREWLEGSPFDSYFIPSLMLVAVGGGMALAGLGWRPRKRRFACPGPTHDDASRITSRLRFQPSTDCQEVPR